ncbi:MAG: 50S ribosomal protein L14e [Candidatus Micrarchaeota archaeon]
MSSMDKGRVCRKQDGRDKGKKCVIVNVVDNTYIEIICKGRKNRRRCNKRHLNPTDEVIDVKSDGEVLKSLV